MIAIEIPKRFAISVTVISVSENPHDFRLETVDFECFRVIFQEKHVKISKILNIEILKVGTEFLLR